MRRFVPSLLIALVAGGLLAFFWAQFVMQPIADFDVKMRDVAGDVELELPPQQPYLLKIWSRAIPSKVLFNGTVLIHAFHRLRKDSHEFYYHIPVALVEPGKNRVRVVSDDLCSLRVKNNLAGGDLIFVTFPPWVIPKQPFTGISFLGSVVIIFLLNRIFLFLNTRVTGIQEEKSVYGSLIFSYSVCFVFWTVFWVLQKYLPFRIGLSNVFFIGLNFFFVFLIQMMNVIKRCVLVIRYWQNQKRMEGQNGPISCEYGNGQERAFSQFQYSQPRYSTWLFDYWVKWTLSDKCLVFFIVFLVWSAFFLAFRLSVIAEIFAGIGFFALCAGVFTKFFLYLKEQRSNECSDQKSI